MEVGAWTCVECECLTDSLHWSLYTNVQWSFYTAHSTHCVLYCIQLYPNCTLTVTAVYCVLCTVYYVLCREHLEAFAKGSVLIRPSQEQECWGHVAKTLENGYEWYAHAHAYYY